MLALALGAAGVRAQTAEVRVLADSVRVGERFRVALVVRHRMAEVVPPDTGAFGPEVTTFGPPRAAHEFGGTREPGLRVDSFVYEAAAFALDTLVVPPVRVRLAVGAGDTLLLTTAPVALKIRRLVPDDSTAALKPPLPREGFGWPWWPFLVGAGLLAALAAGLLYRRRRPRVPVAPPAAPERPKTAHEILLLRLAALAATPPRADDDPRPFFSDLSDAVRGYIADRLNLPARELTSGDIVGRLERFEAVGAVGPDTAVVARALFEAADLVKFADARPEPETADLCIEQARAFAAAVESTRRTTVPRPAVRPAPLAPPPVPRPSPPAEPHA